MEAHFLPREESLCMLSAQKRLLNMYGFWYCSKCTYCYAPNHHHHWQVFLFWIEVEIWVLICSVYIKYTLIQSFFFLRILVVNLTVGICYYAHLLPSAVKSKAIMTSIGIFLSFFFSFFRSTALILNLCIAAVGCF